MFRTMIGMLALGILLIGCNGSGTGNLAAAPTTQQTADAANAIAMANQALELAQQTAADLQAIPSPTKQQTTDLARAQADIKILQAAVAAIPPTNTQTPALQQVTAAIGQVAATVPTPYSVYIAAGAGLLLLLERLYQNYQAGGTGSTIASMSSTIAQAAQDIAAIAATQSAHGQTIAKLAANSAGAAAPASA
jgi:hypothetical protein